MRNVRARHLMVLMVLAVVGLAPTAAKADYTYFDNFGSFQSFLNANLPGEDLDNLLYNEPGLISTGPLVQGVTNQGGEIFDIFDAGVDLEVVGGGQSLIQTETQPGTFTTVTIAPNDSSLSFRAIAFIVTLAGQGNPSADITLEPTPDSPSPFTFLDADSGFFGVVATNGQTMDQIIISSSGPIQDVRQVRVAGVGGTPAVPEPSSLALAATGLLSLGLVTLRRRRAAAKTA